MRQTITTTISCWRNANTICMTRACTMHVAGPRNAQLGNTELHPNKHTEHMSNEHAAPIASVSHLNSRSITVRSQVKAHIAVRCLAERHDIDIHAPSPLPGPEHPAAAQCRLCSLGSSQTATLLRRPRPKSARTVIPAKYQLMLTTNPTTT